MRVYLVRFICILAAIFCLGCSASQRAISALEDGNHCKFCQISAESLDEDHYSINNLGVCYDHGYCGYPKDKQQAVYYYNLAARWGVEQSIANLAIHGLKAPAPDLKMAEDQREKELIGGIIATALMAGAVAIAAQNPGPPANNQMFLSPVASDYQGCCSYHGGIARDIYHQPLCHFSGKILCQDYQPSPTCLCN